MTKRILIAAIILWAHPVHAQQTLSIIEQDYELAKQTAKEQHKLLIVDFYTTWCVPCKMLDKKIFKNDSMANEISKNYVVLKYDAEKDSVYNLSLKHHIASYPTTVVLTADGKFIRKMFGTGGPKPLVENYAALLKESVVLNKEGKYIEGVSSGIDPNIYPDFYKKYIRRTADLKPEDLSNYWANNNDLKSEVSFDILAYFGKAPERVIDFFIQHKTEYEKQFGSADLEFVISGIVSDKFRDAIAAKDEAKYEAAVDFAKQHLSLANAHEYINGFGLEMQIAMSNWDKAVHIIDERIRLKTISENEVNYFCWRVYEKCDEKRITEEAVRLMKHVIDSNSSFAVLDTYARLLSKNGNKEEAVIEMKHAIEKGKANGEDTKESEEALRKF